MKATFVKLLAIQKYPTSVGSTEAKQLLYVTSLDCYEFPLSKVEGLRKTKINLELVVSYCNINHILEKKRRRFFVVWHSVL